MIQYDRVKDTTESCDSLLQNQAHLFNHFVQYRLLNQLSKRSLFFWCTAKEIKYIFKSSSKVKAHEPIKNVHFKELFPYLNRKSSTLINISNIKNMYKGTPV